MYQLFENESVIEIYSDGFEAGCVGRALEDLKSDIYKVSGKETEIKRYLPQDQGACMVVGTLTNERFAAFLQIRGIDVSSIKGEWEHYMILTYGEEQPCLIICGSDKRGTMWGIYEFCERFLGVDPLYLWTDQEPVRREHLSIPNTAVTDGPKTYRFRGWFINDEDLLTGWSAQMAAERAGSFHENYPPVLEQILETALRLKQNLIIPCSHIDIDDPAQENIVRLVTERGLYISQHHQEPVGVLQTTIDRHLKEKGIEPVPGYVECPELYEAEWRHSIQKWAKYEGVIWQLGLRGRGDRPLWYQNAGIPNSMEARGQIISSAIAAQAAIINEVYGGKPFISSSTLWMEGMGLYKGGNLSFPEDTMVIFADFGPNQMWGEGYDTANREETWEYGVYYHVAFWGCGPHMVQGNPPEKIYYNYRKAAEKGDTCYSILNVSNIREFVQGIEYTARITWDMERFRVDKFLTDWCGREYGHESAKRMADIYKQYFESFYEINHENIEKEMLLMDGMTRRVALKLIGLIEGAEFTAEDIQNKKLFDFSSGAEFITCYKTASEEGIRKWKKFYHEAYRALSGIKKDRQPFFISHVIVQAELILGLYSWVFHLATAAEIHLSGTEGTKQELFGDQIREAMFALEKAVIDRRKAQQGKWQGWYEGDELMNLEEDIEITGRLCGEKVK